MERNTEMLEKQKADLRKEIRGQLRLLPKEEKEILDRQIAERVLTLPAVTDAGAVYGYASLNWETGTAAVSYTHLTLPTTSNV